MRSRKLNDDTELPSPPVVVSGPSDTRSNSSRSAAEEYGAWHECTRVGGCDFKIPAHCLVLCQASKRAYLSWRFPWTFPAAFRFASFPAQAAALSLSTWKKTTAMTQSRMEEGRRRHAEAFQSLQWQNLHGKPPANMTSFEKASCFERYNINLRTASRKETRDPPISLFRGRHRCMGHSWADSRFFKIFLLCFLLHYQKYNVVMP